MGPGSSIIGQCKIAKYTHLGINTSIRDQNTQVNTVVIGNSPSLSDKALKRNLIKDIYFNLLEESN
jgi:hypothetical protein